MRRWCGVRCLLAQACAWAAGHCVALAAMADGRYGGHATSGRRGDAYTATPCNFPTPEKARAWGARCSGAYLRSTLPFVCDLQQQLTVTEAGLIDAGLNTTWLFDNRTGRHTVGVALLRELRAPHTHVELWDEPRLACLGDVETEAAVVMADSHEHYLQTFAKTLHLRWFGGAHSSRRTERNREQDELLVTSDGGGKAKGKGDSDDSSKAADPCPIWTMLVIVTEKVVHGLRSQRGRATKLGRPMVAVSTGNNPPRCKRRAQRVQSALESYVDTEAAKRADLAPLLRGLLDELAKVLGKTADQRKRDHRIPRWAVHAFAGSLGVAVGAVLLEYVVVRRKEGVQRRSAASQSQAAKGPGGGSGAKTHMMFK